MIELQDVVASILRPIVREVSEVRDGHTGSDVFVESHQEIVAAQAFLESRNGRRFQEWTEILDMDLEI